MKNKSILIVSVATVSLALGFVTGYFIRKSENPGSSISEVADYNIPDSTINRALDMPGFCNEDVVAYNIKKNFSFYYPTTEIVENSMEIQELGECLYHVRLKAKKGYTRKILILEYSYDYTFSKYFIKTLRESNY